MRTGLDFFLDQVKALIKTRPPYNASFTTQALYLLNQAVTTIIGMNEIIRKQKQEIEKLSAYEQGTKKVVIDKDRNQQIVKHYEDGMLIKDIADKHNLTPGRVSQILLRAGARDVGPPRVKRLPD